MTGGPVRVGPAAVHVTVPAGAIRGPGVRMAGFHGSVGEPVDLPIVPYPAFTVLVDLGDSVRMDDGRGVVHAGCVVSGPGPGRLRGRPSRFDLLQIRVSPVRAAAVLGDPAEIGGAVVSLDQVWGRDAARVTDRILAAASWDGRFRIALEAIRRRAASGPAADPEVAFAWGRLVSACGRVRVESLAAEAGWSRRRLWSRFRAQTGLTPKGAARLIRFDAAAHRLAAGGRIAGVAADCGYADQSHLNRDSVALAGMTPAQVSTAGWLAVDPRAWS